MFLSVMCLMNIVASSPVDTCSAHVDVHFCPKSLPRATELSLCDCSKACLYFGHIITADRSLSQTPSQHKELSGQDMEGRMQNAETRINGGESQGKATRGEGRRKNDEMKRWQAELPKATPRPPHSHPHATHKPGDSVLLSCVPLVLLLCSSCSSLLFPWGLPGHHAGSTEPVAWFDGTGPIIVQMHGQKYLVFTRGSSWRILAAGSAVAPALANEKPVRQL